jgi:hypothetical protein
MAFMADRRMPTFGTVFMGMVGMVLLVTGSHRIFSFLLLRSGEPADYCLSAARSMVPANAERECRKASSRCALRRLLTRPPPRDSMCQLGVVHTWHKADIAPRYCLSAPDPKRTSAGLRFRSAAGSCRRAIFWGADPEGTQTDSEQFRSAPRTGPPAYCKLSVPWSAYWEMVTCWT